MVENFRRAVNGFQDRVISGRKEDDCFYLVGEGYRLVSCHNQHSFS